MTSDDDVPIQNGDFPVRNVKLTEGNPHMVPQFLGTNLAFDLVNPGQSPDTPAPCC